jgi:ferredoxin--NADP+ reductase
MTENKPELDTMRSCPAVVRESKRITPATTEEVRHIVLRIDDPSFRFVEGQSIGVLVPGPHPFGNKFHHRYYSIANARNPMPGDEIEIDLLVRRCFYIDEVSGERYPGIASNYLCDARPGEKLAITGPFRSSFRIPADDSSNLLMIGTGTGIAPFRSFIQRVYDQRPTWKGEVRLFYGAETGMDLLYMNDVNNDLANYYDEATFKAFQAVNRRPLSRVEEALQNALQDNVAEAWSMIQDPKTHVFLAGIDKIVAALDKVMAAKAGSEEQWQRKKQQMIEEKRWSELVYH